MSRVVDERVVSMQFDNKQFESNVATSMGTLERLKRSLNLSGASKGLENVNAAARKCNLSPLSSAAETVGLKFNAMYTIADQALRNIVNSAMAAGKNITNALTIEPIKTGFKEYETQINAVQTILANTQSKGSTLDDVNMALDELNTYADKTIYNFTEMTRNIGTFTAAGVDLDKSVTSIKGIANLAAVSGSTSQQASTAMYQLSQALAAGTVKLMDWNSVVNAGMGGQLFQDALKRTATQMGYNVDQMIEKYGSFRESLTQGEWVTAEVLTETLTQLSGAYTEADLIAQGYSESQAKEIAELADTAVQAATKVKTFTQLIDTTKEAAQSGWTQTWELIIGDFEQAKSLWSGVSDVLGEIIGKMSDSRNEVLGGALKSNWEKINDGLAEAGVSTEEFEKRLRSLMEADGRDVDKLLATYGSFEEVFRSGAVSSKWLKDALDNLTESVSDLSGVEAGLAKGDANEQVKKVQEALMGMGFDMAEYGADGIFGRVTEDAVKAFQELEGLEVTGIIDDTTLKALEEATTSSVELKESLHDLVDGIDELGGRERLLNAFKNIWTAIVNPIKAVGKAWNNVFGTSAEDKSAKLFGLIKGFESFTEKLVISSDSAEKITKIFGGLFSVIKIGAGFVGGSFKMAFKALSATLENFDLNILDVLASIGDLITKAYKWVDENNIIGESISFIVGMVMLGVGKIQEWFNAFMALPGVQERITAIRDAFAGIGDYLGGGIKKVQEFFKALSGPNLKLFFDNGELGKAFRAALIDNFKNNVLGYFSNIGEKIGEFVAKIITPLGQLKNSAGKYLSETGDKFVTFKDKLVEFFSGIKEWVGDNKGAIAGFGSLLALILVLSKINKGVSKIAGVFESFSGIGESISTFVDSFTAINSAKAKAIKMDAISNLIKSMALLAGAVALLAMVPEDDIKRAVKVMGVLAGGVLAMVLLLKLINKIPTGGETDLVQFGKLMSKLGWALMLMTVSIKILGGMDPGELKQGMWSVATFMGMVMLLMASTKFIDSKDMKEFGKMIRSLSISLLILSGVVYIFGKMEFDTLLQGGLAVGGFLVIMGFVMKMTKDIGKDSDKFGKMIRNISVSLILLSAAVYILGKMDRDTLIQGGIAVAAFLGIMLGAMELTKPMSKNIASFGKMMFGLSAGLIMMALAVKILGSMDTGTLIKGGIAMVAFVGIVALLAKTTDLLGRYSFNAGKMGVMLLGFGAAVLLITASVLALSMLEGDKLKRAMIAVGGIGVIFAGILVATKFAKSIKTGTLLGIGIAIGIMAASVVALSFIDEKDLRNATLALGAIIGMCALMGYAIKDVKMGSILSLAGMVLIIGGIAVAIVALSKHVKDSDNALKVALAMSAIITALSASVLLLSKVGKLNKGAIATIGILTLILGAVAGIAIWQLPNIAKQLSAFATELDPFITTMSKLKVNKGGMDALKSLGEAMWSFTKAGAVYTVFNKLGMSEAYTAFGQFIKDIIPIVKDLALDVSGEGVTINTDNLNAVLGAVSTLAEASNKAASINIVAGGGGGKGFGGGFLGISIPQMKAFTEWITAAIPAMKDLALAMSDKSIEINDKALTSVCEGVATLAEAADKAPSIDIAGAFTKFTGGWGVGGGVSFPGLTGFLNFIKSVVPIMKDFAVDISGANITEASTSVIKSICEAVKILAEGADAAPSIDIAAGFAKFAGGGGFGTYVSIPGLQGFKQFLIDVIPEMSGFTIDATKAGIKEKDTSVIKSICEAVKILAEGADAAPSIDIAAGFAAFAAGAAGGTYISIPGLQGFKQFLIDVIPEMSGFAIEAEEAGISEKDASVLKSICEAVKVLGEASQYAPSTEVATMIAACGPAVGGGHYISSTDLDSLTTFITNVIPSVTGFTVEIKEAGIKEEDGAKLQSICKAVTILAEAAKEAPKAEMYSGVFGVYVSTTDLGDFTTWIVDVLPKMAEITASLSTAMTESGDELITTDSLNKITSLCNSVKILADAASVAPKQETYSNIFGTWIEVSDLEGFGTWIEEVITVLNDVGTTISESNVELDTEKLKALAEAAGNLGLACYYFTQSSSLAAGALENFPYQVETLTTTLTTFGEKMKEVNVDEVSKGADSVFDLANTVTTLANFNPKTVDLEGFSSTVEGIAGAAKTMETKLAGVNVETVATKAAGIKGVVESLTTVSTKGLEDFTKAITNLSSAEFGGLSKLGDSLETVGNDAVSKFVAAFENAGPKASTAGSNMVLQLITGIGTGISAVTATVKALADAAVLAITNKYSAFYNAGLSVVQGFANGITLNTYLATAKAKAMATAAYEAAKKALDVNSPSKIFRSLGYSVPEGFAMGIDRMGGMVKKSSEAMADTAFEGTKSTIARLADSISADIDTQPTIRPVLDLSDVRSGASRIGGMFGINPSVGVLSNVGTINSMMNARVQNGANNDVISAINDLGKKLGSTTGDTYNVNGVTYDDGSNIVDAVKTLVRAAKVERRI